MIVTPEIKKLIVKARKNGKRVKDIAYMFDVNTKTVWKWSKRAHQLERTCYKRVNALLILDDYLRYK